ncbi:MAG: hypothetical protein RSB41_01495 [Bacilli bacterium]
MNTDIFKYYQSDEFQFIVKTHEFISFLGSGNSSLFNKISFRESNDFINFNYSKVSKMNLYKYRKDCAIMDFSYINLFLCDTVAEEIAFGMEGLAYSRDKMKKEIDKYCRLFSLDELLNKDPNSLGVSDKIKVKLSSFLAINPKVIVLYDVLSSLDYNDLCIVTDVLKEFCENDGIVLNFTSDVEECMYSKRVIITDNKKILVDGELLSVMNEEAILKRLGIGLPFIIELNKYLMDYSLIDEYILDIKKLGDVLWK